MRLVQVDTRQQFLHGLDPGMKKGPKLVEGLHKVKKFSTQPDFGLSLVLSLCLSLFSLSLENQHRKDGDSESQSLSEKFLHKNKRVR